MAAFRAQGLAKRYGSVTALGGVDLEVAEGELVGLLGPNGAGKSTLVKIACGLVRATAGTAEVAGAPAGSATARASLGYLAELFRFPGWYEADELLALHQRLAGSSGGEGERAELLELVGLTEAKSRKVEDMSKGMQQRLGIAQALVGTPPLLFLDEPTSARGRAPPPLPRGADERARPRGPADGPRAARGAPSPRRRRPAQLAPAQRGRARLRPRGHPLQGPRRRSREDRGAGSPPRRGDRHRGRDSDLRGGAAGRTPPPWRRSS